jgi:hypothetical protein
MTNLPPPPGFDGGEGREWGDLNYERDCTPEEAKLLEASDAASGAAERAEEEQLREALFDMLRSDLEEPPGKPAAIEG